jgi:hypothetical protein
MPEPNRCKNAVYRARESVGEWVYRIIQWKAELLNREIFTTLTEAKVLIEQWKREYNQVRPHSSLGYRPPAPEARIPVTLTQRVVPFMGAGHLLVKASTDESRKIPDKRLDNCTI